MGPYSMDLRERVAAALDEGEGSERQIAKRFRVSVSFATRLLQRRRDAGTLAPKPHGGGPRPVLGFPEQVRLAMLIAEHPDATLNQLKEWGGFACTLTTLWRTLRRFRLTYKKKTLHAGERDTPEVQAKRRRYRAKVRRIEAKRETVASLPGPIRKIARQEQGESTWDPLNACELAPNSANSLIPSLIAWAKSQPPGNVAIVSKTAGFRRRDGGQHGDDADPRLGTAG